MEEINPIRFQLDWYFLEVVFEETYVKCHPLGQGRNVCICSQVEMGLKCKYKNRILMHKYYKVKPVNAFIFRLSSTHDSILYIFISKFSFHWTLSHRRRNKVRWNNYPLYQRAFLTEMFRWRAHGLSNGIHFKSDFSKLCMRQNVPAIKDESGLAHHVLQ